MKNSWLVWLFVVGVIITVFVAFNYQDRQKTVSLNDIFPEEYSDPVDVEYEFVDETPIAVKAVEEGAVEAIAKQEARVSVIPTPQQVASEPVKSAPPAPPVAAKAPVAKIDNAAPKSGFTIQVASFKEKGMADKMAEELRKKNFVSSVGQRNLGDKGIWYRVYVGQYESKAQAEANLGAVKAIQPNSFVISIPK